MPPIAAAFLCIAFIIFAFWRDRKSAEGLSWALWIPQIWMLLVGSRYVGQWMELGTRVYVSAGDAYMEGSPTDRMVFFLLMSAGVVILIQRRVSWVKLLTQNWLIWLYFLFGAFSLLWSDFPDVSGKRLYKAVGNVIMALVILTEVNPFQAVGVVFRRMGMLLLPLSALFIKYYPQWGRGYHVGGQPMYIGVTTQKNSLGALCFLCGLYFIAAMLPGRRGDKAAEKTDVALNLVFLALTAWLLNLADSATSLACLVLAVGILAVSRMPLFSNGPRRLFVVGVVAAVILGILEGVFDFSNVLVSLLGRDENLTTRVPMWRGLLEMAGDPLVGVGYESFWLGPRLEVLWPLYGRLNQAHNGYLETYLNLGWIGVTLIIGGILAGLLKVWRDLPMDYPGGVWKLCFIITIAAYNYTEATFHGINNLWLLLFLGILDVSGQKVRQAHSDPLRQTYTRIAAPRPSFPIASRNSRLVK